MTEMHDLENGCGHRLLAPRLVVVVGTIRADGVAHACPVTNVSQLSWDPPLVTLAVWKEWTTHRNLCETNGFTLSIPCKEQLELVWRLGHRYSGFDYETPAAKLPACGGNWREDWSNRGPVLDGAVGWIECQKVDQLEIRQSDHTLFVGKIERAAGRRGVVRADGTYARASGTVAQVTGNVFAVDAAFMELPYFGVE